MQRDNLFDDIQANTNSMNVLDRCIRHTIKALEQLGQRVGRDTNALISHMQRCQRRTLVGRDSYLYSTAVWAIAHSVLEQIPDHCNVATLSRGGSEIEVASSRYSMISPPPRGRGLPTMKASTNATAIKPVISSSASR
jgi:hypothetical protein